MGLGERVGGKERGGGVRRKEGVGVSREGGE